MSVTSIGTVASTYAIRTPNNAIATSLFRHGSLSRYKYGIGNAMMTEICNGIQQAHGGEKHCLIPTVSALIVVPVQREWLASKEYSDYVCERPHHTKGSKAAYPLYHRIVGYDRCVHEEDRDFAEAQGGVPHDDEGDDAFVKGRQCIFAETSNDGDDVEAEATIYDH
jgi:hypothetical protein